MWYKNVFLLLQQQNSNNSKVWRSLDSETNTPGTPGAVAPTATTAVLPARPPLFKTRSSSMPAPGTKKLDNGKSQSRVGRASVSNENNILLDPEVLTDYPTQVLVLTVLVGTGVPHWRGITLTYWEIINFRWTFNFRLFVGRAIHEFKIQTK